MGDFIPYGHFNDYFIGEKLGQGSYASVHKAAYSDNTGKRIELACKIYDTKKSSDLFLIKFLPRELDILRKIKNKHLITVYGVVHRGDRILVFMNFAEKGDLLDYIQKKGALPEHNAKTWFSQIVKGLKYLHDNDIVHRDLKCENILLTRNNDVVISDFGFARYFNEWNDLSRTYCGSASYAAPEIVSGTPYTPKSADIWSLGVVLYVMLNATMPFDDRNLSKLLIDQVFRNFKFKSVFESILSRAVKELVMDILEPNVMTRPTLEDILRHEWLKMESNMLYMSDNFATGFKTI